MREGALSPDDVTHVTARVHQAAIDVLGPVTDPQTVHQAKFSMGSVLALAATRQNAGMLEFDRFFQAPQTKDFARKVTMVFDPEVQAAYPQRWIGKVDVETADGRRLAGRVDEPKGDPGNTLSRAELEAKALGLAQFSHSATPEEMAQWFLVFSGLGTAPRPPRFFGPESAPPR
jgi:2-methylcitrate dehydratase PrpD